MGERPAWRWEMALAETSAMEREANGTARAPRPDGATSAAPASHGRLPPASEGPGRPMPSPRWSVVRRWSGRRVTGPGRVDGEGCRGVPLVEVDEFVQRPAPDGAVAAHRTAQGDGAGHEHVVGDTEKLPELGVDEQIPHGHHAPVTE